MFVLSRPQMRFAEFSLPKRPVAMAVLVVVLLVTGSATAQTDDELSLTSLLLSFRTLEGLSADFHETQYLAILRQPLEYDGTLHFVSPSRFVRHTTAPLVSTVLIDGNRLEFGDEYSADALDLGTAPVVRQFTSMIFDVLQGDEEALLAAYSVELSTPEGGAAPETTWRLTLTPRDSPLDTFIESVTIDGRGIILESTHIVEPGGDERHLVYSNVVLNPQFNDLELETLFAVPSPR